MALPSGFRERLEQMEQTRNQRLSLLQAEKELQITKSQVLAARLSNIRSLERRCLNLDLKISSQHFIISSLKSEMDRLDSDYLSTLQKVRYLKNEVEELEELEKEKQKYYASENKEMDEFMEQVGNFVLECQVQIEELRCHANELKSIFSELKGNLNHSNNSEIAAAERRKSELLTVKESVDRDLALNYQLREQLRRQLLNLLINQNPQRE
nr:probable kinetochore protein NDC80 [Ipomoea batatas]GME15646.1 probable kinetochore protein NDC80 [Ipomoea batatas]